MIPAINQRPAELVEIFVSGFKSVNGDKFEFVRRLSQSDNSRFRDMTPFEIELMYEFCNRINR